MPGKRQHFVPLFLLRRFSTPPEYRRLTKLEVRSGRPAVANPKNEAVRNRYYRIEHEDGTVDDSADEVLDRIESDAARVIRYLETPGNVPGGQQRSVLSLFVLTLKQRTPDARAHLHEVDGQIAALEAEVRLSDPDVVRRIAGDDERDEADLEGERLRLLEDLREGRLVFESTPSREVGLMFMALEHGHEVLMTQIAWTLLRTSPGQRFVLSDDPVCHYDMTPRIPGAGASFTSSPMAMTVVPLDPSMALLLMPSDVATWEERLASRQEVDDINLLIYAQAHQVVYGQNQSDVTAVRAAAKANPRRVGQYRRMPPRLWIAEVGPDDAPGDGRVRRFTSTSGGVTLTRQLHVSREAEQEARRRAWPRDL